MSVGSLRVTREAYKKARASMREEDGDLTPLAESINDGMRGFVCDKSVRDAVNRMGRAAAFLEIHDETGDAAALRKAQAPFSKAFANLVGAELQETTAALQETFKTLTNSAEELAAIDFDALDYSEPEVLTAVSSTLNEQISIVLLLDRLGKPNTTASQTTAVVGQVRLYARMLRDSIAMLRGDSKSKPYAREARRRGVALDTSRLGSVKTAAQSSGRPVDVVLNEERMRDVRALTIVLTTPVAFLVTMTPFFMILMLYVLKAIIKTPIVIVGVALDWDPPMDEQLGEPLTGRIDRSINALWRRNTIGRVLGNLWMMMLIMLQAQFFDPVARFDTQSEVLGEWWAMIVAFLGVRTAIEGGAMLAAQLPSLSEFEEQLPPAPEREE